MSEIPAKSSKRHRYTVRTAALKYRHHNWRREVPSETDGAALGARAISDCDASQRGISVGICKLGDMGTLSARRPAHVTGMCVIPRTARLQDPRIQCRCMSRSRR